jgi:mono/diheme cytochrome c family protein
MHHGLIAVTGAVTLAGLIACTQVSMPEPQDGQRFFAANCTACHGGQGKGDGPAAAGLDPAPSDLTVLARANGGGFPRARALSYIYGTPDQSHLARVMPQFGGAMAEDLVPVVVDGVETPTPRVLAGLLAYLESIQR